MMAEIIQIDGEWLVNFDKVKYIRPYRASDNSPNPSTAKSTIVFSPEERIFSPLTVQELLALYQKINKEEKKTQEKNRFSRIDPE